ncbi:MAG: hypothetical protein JW944_01995 [Deltaproteobacteria bacterium]|nr:hypothetical protein [Deltaproteobacteria bacterium]
MNINMFKGTVLSLLISLGVIISITGCQTANKNIVTEHRVIKAGDKVTVDFTCRLKDGGIVMTTDADVLKDENKAKAGIFLPLKEYEPIPIVAGSGKGGPDYGKLKSLENEILEELSLVVAGMEEGSSASFEITSESTLGLNEDERYLSLSRVRRQPKKQKVNPVAFEKSQGRAPVPGDIVLSEEIEGVSITVVSVTEKEMEVRLEAKEGTMVYTPLGKGTIYDAGDYYKIIIDIHEGQLIRSGVIVGRVTVVEEDRFTIDYGHPFGYETLVCDVMAKKDRTANEKEDKQ